MLCHKVRFLIPQLILSNAALHRRNYDWAHSHHRKQHTGIRMACLLERLRKGFAVFTEKTSGNIHTRRRSICMCSEHSEIRAQSFQIQFLQLYSHYSQNYNLVSQTH